MASAVQTSLGKADSAIQTITAVAGTNINTVGTPSVTASTSGDTTTLTFNYLKGATGANGTNGTNGTSAYWFTGTAVTGTNRSGISASVSGSKAGDMYLNTSTYHVYKATAANTWGYVCNIEGATGSNGTNGTNGTSAFWFTGTAVTGTGTGISASVSNSKAGDMYLNTSTYNVYLATAANKWDYKCNIKGATGSNGSNGSNGAAAGFGTPTASVDANVGTPSVTITASGADTAKVFNFAFKNLKGQPGTNGTNGTNGTTPSITATATVDSNTGTPGVTVTKSGTDAAPSFAFAFSNLKGAAGQNATTTSVFSASANGLAPAASSTNKTTAESSVSNYYLCADGKYRQLPANAFNNTTYTFDGTYNASTNKAATVSTVTTAIGALDGTVSGSAGAGKTLTAFSQTDGKVSATFGNISITKSQVSDFPSLATVATSGSYNDLSNKPTIPAAAANGTYTIKTLVGSTTTNVSDFTANQSSADDLTIVQGANVTITPDATNRKITIAATDTNTWRPVSDSVSSTSSSDAASSKAVKTAYDLAASKTANTGTITGITMNGASKGTSGVVNLGTVLTSHQDISGKVDKTTTVNGHALSSNVTVTKSDIGLGNVGNFKAVSTVAS